MLAGRVSWALFQGSFIRLPIALRNNNVDGKPTPELPGPPVLVGHTGLAWQSAEEQKVRSWRVVFNAWEAHFPCGRSLKAYCTVSICIEEDSEIDSGEFSWLLLSYQLWLLWQKEREGFWRILRYHLKTNKLKTAVSSLNLIIVLNIDLFLIKDSHFQLSSMYSYCGENSLIWEWC